MKKIYFYAFALLNATALTAQNEPTSFFKKKPQTISNQKSIVSRPGKMERSYWDNGNAVFNVQDSSYYTYDASAKLLTTTVKYLGVNYYRNTITYDALGRQTLDLRQNWDNATSTWVNNFKDEITFNTQGDITSSIYSDFDVATSTWLISGGNQKTYVYNAQNLQIEVINLNFDNLTLLSFQMINYSM